MCLFLPPNHLGISPLAVDEKEDVMQFAPLKPGSRSRGAFTLVELLVVIAIIGVMVGLLLPAVQSAREAARRMSCSNNIKQIGLGIHMYHDAFRALPATAYALQDAAQTNRPASWIVRILPFIEQTAAFEQTRFDNCDFSNRSGTNTSWAAYNNLNVTTLNCPSSPLPIFRSDTTTATTRALGAPNTVSSQISCYAGVAGQYDWGSITVWNGWSARADYNGVMIPVDSLNSKALTFASVLDGTSYTLTVGEQANWKTVIDAAGAKTTFDDRSSNMNGGAWCGGGGHPNQADIAMGYRQNVSSIRAGINYTPVAPATRHGNPGIFGVGFWGSVPGSHTPFTSAHVGGAQFLKLDGSVQFISENIRFDILTKLANRMDKLVVEEF
jgi:prepilin-type N-terminal cleavage/methylation domain-containing protein